MDVGLDDGDEFVLGSARARVMFIPGHTRGHIAFVFPGAAFVGDTLFSLGCGRLFEGTPQQMWSSLCRLRDLPEDTRVYCGHEYTKANAKFAVTIDPDNTDLQKRADEVERLRAHKRPTVPSTIGQERLANPFLRADDPALQKALGMSGTEPWRVFAEMRHRKDHF
jgi:hydroxyacylglutathione hydrolase